MLYDANNRLNLRHLVLFGDQNVETGRQSELKETEIMK